MTEPKHDSTKPKIDDMATRLPEGELGVTCFEDEAPLEANAEARAVSQDPEEEPEEPPRSLGRTTFSSVVDGVKVKHNVDLSFLDGHYSDLHAFDAGGMGTIYKGTEAKSKTQVIIKVMPPLKKGSLRWKRFKRESTALTMLQHPNIVTYRDHGIHFEETDNEGFGVPYLVMDFIPGKNLEESTKARIEAKQAPPFTILIDQFATLSRALLECHHKGLIHRDLKPLNIVIDSRNNEPVLIDFGLVKANLGGSDRPGSGFSDDLTKTGELIGTPLLMAPEQFFGSTKDVGPATDVWAFGACFYYSIAGRFPFQCENLLDLTDALESKDPPSLAELVPDVPDWIPDLCRRCLDRSPKNRISLEEASQILIAKSSNPPREHKKTLLFIGLAVILLAIIAWAIISNL